MYVKIIVGTSRDSSGRRFFVSCTTPQAVCSHLVESSQKSQRVLWGPWWSTVPSRDMTTIGPCFSAAVSYGERGQLASEKHYPTSVGFASYQALPLIGLKHLVWDITSLIVLDAIKPGETWIMVRMPHLGNCFPRIQGKAQRSLQLRSFFFPPSHRPKYLSHWPTNSEDSNDKKTWDVLKNDTLKTVILWRIIDFFFTINC